jgi:hypothetical protein
MKKSQETLLKSHYFCVFSRQLTQFLSHGELGVFEETQSRCLGMGNVKCEYDIEMELVVKCEPDKAGEINGK